MAHDSATPPSATRGGDPRPGGNGVAARYRERLTVPWFAWPLALAVAALLAAEVFLGAPTALAWVPYAILLPATAATLLVFGRIVVEIRDAELYVDDAHLPLTYVTEVNVLDAAAKHAVLGPLSQRYAFVVQRPWIGGAVRVVIDDPDDPTPYWVVSSRRPATLAAAIVAGRDGARGSS
ncbi:MAG TPA: DUF3093 domain-containing protein [Micromonosporaceae bacterium]|nr:DUF3093 domain-containing protein [Micromonosporaceae bacterium]